MNRLYDPKNLPAVPIGSHAEEGDSVDVASIWRVVRRFKFLFIGAPLGLMIVAVLISAVMDKKYTATAELLVNPPRQSIVDVDAFEQQASPNSFVDSQVELVRSRVNAERAAETVDLAGRRQITELVDGAGPQSLLSLAYWKNLIGLDTAETSENLPLQTRKELAAIGYVLENQSIGRVGITDIIRIKFTSTDPRLSAAIANAVAKSYLERDRENRVQSIEAASVWLDGQIEEMRETVARDERAVEEYRAQKNLVNVSGGSLTDQRRAEVNRQLVMAQGDLAEAEARLQRVESIVRNGGDIESIAEILASETVSDLRREQALLTRRQAELLARYGERHPSVVNVSAELGDIQVQIEAEANRIVSNISNDVALASSRLRTLRAEQISLDADAALDENARIELREFERQANASRQLYETLLEGYQTSFVAGNAEALSPAALLVSPATKPEEASFPNTKLFAVIGLLFGLIVASVYAFLIYILDNKVMSLGEMEARTGLTPLISLQKLSGNELDKDNLIHYLREHQMSSFSESLKRLRGTLELANIDNPPKLIQVSSALPAEGKTTTAIGIATSYALAKKKTLLVDLDLRRPTVYKRLGMPKPKSGILSVFTNKAKLEDVITTDENGLDYLLNSTVPVNSADILNSAAMERLMAILKEKYDKVIIDSAPILPIIDSALLSRHMDAVVMSVMWNETPGPAVSQAAKIFADHGAYLLGGILTAVDPAKAQQYGRYGGYDDMKYYKRYGAYYSQ